MKRQRKQGVWDYERMRDSLHKAFIGLSYDERRDLFVVWELEYLIRHLWINLIMLVVRHWPWGYVFGVVGYFVSELADLAKGINWKKLADFSLLSGAIMFLVSTAILVTCWAISNWKERVEFSEVEKED